MPGGDPHLPSHALSLGQRRYTKTWLGRFNWCWRARGGELLMACVK